MEYKPEEKVCQNCKSTFTIEPNDFVFYEKIKVPPPTWCAKCRLKRRLSFRNERNLYKRKCDLCKEIIISMYSPKSPYIIYCQRCWYSDKWNPYDYGKEYDFTRSFFEQFIELDKLVPHMSLIQENVVNSPWVNYEMDDKNCYLNVGGHFNQDCAYNQYALKSRDSFDNFWMMHGEYSYENILCENVYKTIGSIFCFESQETWFSFDCRNCSNIIGCSGLRNKSYYIFNQSVSREEYKSYLEKNLSGSRESFIKVKEISKEFWKKVPQKTVSVERSINCEGNLIKDSKNCKDVWNIEKSENIFHAIFCLNTRDSVDVTSVWNGELSYEFLGGTDFSNILCSLLILNSSNISYSNNIFNSNNIFGSTQLRNAEYVILNKKYSKNEYIALKEKIIQHMDEITFVDRCGRIYRYGDFFPYETSIFSYDESIANEYFTLNTKEMQIEGTNLYNYKNNTEYNIEVTTPPDLIQDVDNSILNKAIKCETTGKLFKLIKMELDFYKRFNLPIPNKSPFVRHNERLGFIANHLKLIKRQCRKCNNNIQSVYSTEEFPIVYCEKCYQKEVY